MSTKSEKESFFSALEALEREKGIPKEYMLERIEAALVNAVKKEYGSTANVRVAFNPDKDDVKVYRLKEVVEEVTDPVCQISLEDAKAISRRNTVGKIIETEVKTKQIRRLSADVAKNVIIQGIREGERMARQRNYESKRGEVITVTVSKIDYETGAVILDTDNGNVVLKPEDQIPGETFEIGEKIKIFVSEVNKESRGPIATFSRTNAGFVRRMFELEVPEITDGTIIIKGISREAGSRTKISVMSRDPDVDPVGACIGPQTMRIDNITNELRGEKVDIVKYSENFAEYVAAALAPATVLSVEMLGDRECRAIVDAGQLSLAIGKEGQNVRLAARLTGFKIDIKAE